MSKTEMTFDQRRIVINELRISIAEMDRRIANSLCLYCEEDVVKKAKKEDDIEFYNITGTCIDCADSLVNVKDKHHE